MNGVARQRAEAAFARATTSSIAEVVVITSTLGCCTAPNASVIHRRFASFVQSVSAEFSKVAMVGSPATTGSERS